MSLCGRCQAPIVWAKDTRDRWIALDPEHVADGPRFVLSLDTPQKAFATQSSAGYRRHVCASNDPPVSADQGSLFD